MGTYPISSICPWLRYSHQNIDGTQRDTYDRTPVRVTDLAITPDFTRLVAVGINSTPATAEVTPSANGTGGLVTVYGLPTKQLEAYVLLLERGTPCSRYSTSTSV